MRPCPSIFHCSGILAVVVALLSALPVNAVVDLYIKVGDLEGESSDVRHAGESKVMAWTWGVSIPGVEPSGLATAGQAEMRSLAIDKLVDRSSPELMAACASGKRFDRAILTARAGGAEGVDFYRFICEDVVVQKVAVESAASDELMIEKVFLSFGRVGVEYLRIRSSGVPSQPIRFAWDIRANQSGGIDFGDGNAPVDSDGDGLPNAWELEFGLNTESDDAATDLDNDGATNLEEFLAGTHPASRDSVLKAQLTAGPIGATGKLTWSSVPGTQYRVLFSDRVNEAFLPFTTSTATTDAASVSVPIETAIRFFRIEVVPQD